MTTIVWDGKILAADKRATLDTGTKAEKGKPPIWRDDAEKLRVYDGSMHFRGEPLLASAIYGDANVGHAVVGKIESGIDVLGGLELAYQMAFKPTSMCEVIIITENKLYSIRMDTSGMTVEEGDRNAKLLLGVGVPAVSLLLKLGLPANMALAAVSLISEKTSPTVDYAVFDENKKRFSEKEFLNMGNNNQLRETIRGLISTAKPTQEGN